MSSVLGSRRIDEPAAVGGGVSGAAAAGRLGLLVLMIALGGCVGGAVGVGYEGGGYSGPYDYDYDYDYGPWGPDYYVGPPVIIGGGVGRGPRGPARGGQPRGGHPHFKPAPPSHRVPSIPSRAHPAGGRPR